MAQYYVKKRAIHSYIQWATYSHDYAELHFTEAETILGMPEYAGECRDRLIEERGRAKKFLDEYDEFMAGLNEVELLVFKHIIKYDNTIKGMDFDRYKKIKLDLYKRWCRKFMPSELVYVHELDAKKLGSFLREARINSGFTRKSVANFLVISESAMKMYEIGERLPKLNVLYALCELYQMNFQETVEKTLIG